MNTTRQAKQDATRAKFFSAWGNINPDLKIDLSPLSVDSSVSPAPVSPAPVSDALACALAIESAEFIEMLEVDDSSYESMTTDYDADVLDT